MDVEEFVQVNDLYTDRTRWKKNVLEDLFFDLLKPFIKTDTLLYTTYVYFKSLARTFSIRIVSKDIYSLLATVQ